MSTINIAGLTPVEDPSYRYKMPRIVGKVEGRGNGIKTVLVNVTDLAASLNREAPEITKFFGCELGSQTSYATDTDRAIVNGAMRDSDLQTHLSKYIENFVLCGNCHLPETHYKIKGGIIDQVCLACGSKTPVDMRHKLTSFILSQHKKAKDAAKKEGKDKKEKKKKSGSSTSATSPTAAGAAAAGEGSPTASAEGSAASTADGSKKKKKDKGEKSGKKKSSKSSSSSSAAAGGDEANGGDGVPENVFGIGENKGTGSADGDEPEEEDESDSRAAEEAMERFKLWLASNPDAPASKQVEELRALQTLASLRPADRVIIFLGAVFSDAVITAKEIETNTEVLKELAPKKIQQRHMIAGFEWLFGTRFPSLAKFFPVALKQLLDQDIVEEEVFFEWSVDLSRNQFTAEQSMICLDTLEQLKASAAPFITWLSEAEEEGEDDDDDEEEEEGDGDEEED